MSPSRRSFPRFVRADETPPIELTPDDLDILRIVFRHRFVRAEDLYRLFPERSADKISRRLVRLFRTGYLDRPIAQIDRFRPGGSQSLVYGLASKGARHLADALGVPVGSGDW